VTPAEVSELIVAEARARGFHRVGITSIGAATRYRAYREWLDAGYAGSMVYLAAPHQLEARRDPRALASNARTIAVVALAYAHRGGDEPGDGPRGFVARYARGRDYHTVVRHKLQELADAIATGVGRPIAARPCVDSAPVLERDYAETAGIGFTAKNTMTIAPGLGSYLVLGELLLDVDAEPTPALDRTAPRCGDCTACLDACPTHAFAEPYVLDARRCISYLTIEHRGVIDRRLRPAMGNMIFGCDVCQQVCPYNAAAPARTPPAPELSPVGADRGALDLIGLLGLGANQLRKLVDGSALRRANRRQLLRNACIALGNSGDAAAVAALERAVADRDPVVRGHAAWALGRLGQLGARTTRTARRARASARGGIGSVREGRAGGRRRGLRLIGHEHRRGHGRESVCSVYAITAQRANVRDHRGHLRLGEHPGERRHVLVLGAAVDLVRDVGVAEPLLQLRLGEILDADPDHVRLRRHADRPVATRARLLEHERTVGATAGHATATTGDARRHEQPEQQRAHQGFRPVSSWTPRNSARIFSCAV